MLERELDVVTHIAKEAGAILLDVYAKDFDVAYKGASDPVTEADTLANTYIVRALREAFPNDGIVAEESADKSDALGKGRVWYVDPLDGTKEFIAKNGEFAVMLGLAIDGAATLGVVFQPEKRKLYRGVVGGKATLTIGEETQELVVSEVAEPSALQLVVSRSHRDASTARLVDALGIQKEMKSGSVGLKVGLIAERAADLYVHLSDKSSAWDTCGPEAILKAAGGRFTDLAGRERVYGGPDLKTRGGILACNAVAYDAVLPAAREVAASIDLI